MRKLLFALLFIACGLNIFVDYLGSPAFGQGFQQQLPVPVPPSFGGIGSTSIKYYGATGDGSTNDTSAFTKAFAVGGYISVPCGTYNVTTTTITQSNTKLIGDGIGCVTIRSTTANQPVILAATDLSNVKISDMTVDRTVVATAGGTGIDYHNSGASPEISNVIVQNQWNGVWLGPTGKADFKNSRVWLNYNVGILLDDTWADGGGVHSGDDQWWLSDILLELNNSHDIEVHAAFGTVTLGQWTNIVTFASTGNCVYAHADVGMSIDSIRMIGGFMGSNNTHCIRLDTRGGNHRFDSIHMELFGNTPTGRTLATAASHTGDCYNFGANEDLVMVSNAYCNQPWGSGVTTSATITQINGGTFQNARGVAGVSSNTSGAKVIMSGVNSGNNGSAWQQYGAFAAQGADLIIIGGRFVANAIAAYGATAGAASISYVNGDVFQLPGLVTNGSLANMAQATIKGRASGAGTGATTDLTAAQAAAIIGAVGGALKSKLFAATRDLAAAAGDVAYTGCGFQPSSILNFGKAGAIDYVNIFGFSDSSKANASLWTTGVAANFTFDGSNLITLGDATTTNYQQALIKTYDPTGFTLTWSKGGTPSGTANLYFLCLG